MATFNFNVVSRRFFKKIFTKKKFYVSVSDVNGIKSNFELKHKSKNWIDLKNGQSFTIELKNTTEKNGYMNWDNNGDTPNNRHHVGDIDQTLMNDFHQKHPDFTLSKVNDNNLSWKVTYNPETKNNESKNKKYGESTGTVTVTFGEDQPPTAQLPPKDANVTTS